jgi:predicted nucleic acid-binding protein
VTLVDTSVWVEHLRRNEPRLAMLLEQDEAACHRFVVGELACGRLARRHEILALLAALPEVTIADHAEVLALVEQQGLAGRDLGWIDVHLLASARLSGASVWTLDRPLERAARDLGLAAG